jgi:hypothetical protein
LVIYGHGGATNGQQAAFHFIPEKQFAITALANSDDGRIITDNLLSWVMEIYFNASLPSPQAIKMTRKALAEYAGTYDLPLSAFELKIEKGKLVIHEIPRGGFPTPDSPPGPVTPPVRVEFYEKDHVVGLDEPMKGTMGDFFRDETGQVRFLRIGGRVHPKVS